MEISALTTTLGANIRALREHHGLTQQQLADYLGLNRVQVTQFEAEDRKPNLATLTKLADLFGLDLAELLSPDPLAASLTEAFAFRSADALSADQLGHIAAFRRIITQYTKMDRLLSRPTDGQV